MPVNQTQQAESLLGQQIGRIRIARLLGRGGVGEVYAGRDELLQREVAVKLIRPQWRLPEQGRASFLAQARVLSALQHPNICQVYDHFVDGDRDVLVLELIEGHSLRERLAQIPALSYRNRLDIALQIAETLVCAHERGITHRDLRPDKVMLTDSGAVKLLDFGLALSPPAQPLPGPREAASGGPGLVAAQHTCGEPATAASDLWHFGILLVELLTGRSARVTTEAAADAPKGPRIGAVQLPCRLPREETRLLTELLQEDPSRRPDARVLLQRLQSIRQRRGRRVRYVVAALLSTLAIVGAARYTLDLRHERNLALAARANADTARLQAEDLALFMLEDLYKGLLEVGRLDLLEPVAKQAVEHFAPARDAEGDAHRALRPESGLALMRAAEVLDFQGRLPESIDVAQRAIGLLERLENEPGSDAEGLHSRYLLAQALAAQSMTLSSAARYSEAIVQAQRALDISLGLMDLIDRPPTPAPSQTSSAVAAEELWHNLLNAHSALGDSQLRAGLPEQAIATLDAAVALVDDAIVARPSLATIRADLLWTRCLAYLDDARSNDLIDACQRPLRMDRQASRDAPDDVQTAYNLANSLWLMGEALRRSGRPLEALDYSQEGAQIARELIRRDPDQPHNHNLLAINLLSRARALEQLGQTEAMQQTLQEVLEITRSIVVGSEDHLIMHTHTTALTLLGRTAEARAWAQKLLDAGWRRPEFLELCQRHALLDDCTATQ